MRRIQLAALAVMGCMAVACGGGGGGGKTETPVSAYAVGGAVHGLAASGLVLHSSLGTGEDLPIAAGATQYAFTGKAAAGTAYAVTVKAQPAGLACTVANATGVLGAADVTNADVTCTPARAIGGHVAGLTAAGLVLHSSVLGGEDLAVAAGATTYAFSNRAVAGTAYAVTVKAQPDGLRCTVANGTGTVGAADVTNADVTCVGTFTIGGAVSGLTAAGLTLHSDVAGGEDLSVASGATSYVFTRRAPQGTQYTLTVAAQPPLVRCTFGGGGTTTTGTVGAANVTNANLTCAPDVVIHRWQAPASWGGSAASFWPDDDAALVQHATFAEAPVAGSYLVETKSVSAPLWMGGAGTEPAPLALDAFPAGTRHGGGPFPTVGLRYQAVAPDPTLDVGKPGDASTDMLVCAVVRPDDDPLFNGQERPIVAKGIGNGTQNIPGGGWVLMQMHASFCLHYENWNGSDPATSQMDMVYTPTYFPASAGNPTTGAPAPDRNPPNPSYLVVCAGRDGNTLRIAVNSIDRDMLGEQALRPGSRLDAGSAHPLTLGGYDTAVFPDGGPAGANHVFRGRIYETAVWKLPATPANLQAKLAAVQGIEPGALYRRNREGPFVRNGTYYTAGRNSPRIDPVKGFLFGLQGWNRLSTATTSPAGQVPSVAVATPGEDFTLWTAAGGASATRDAAVAPPNTLPRDTQGASSRITIPAGGSLSVPLGAFDSAGTIHGQIYVRSTTTGTLRIRTNDPAPGQSDRFLVTLDGQQQWQRVWLRTGTAAGQQLTTSGPAGTPPAAPAIFLENEGTTEIVFHAWGFDLTQIGKGGDLGAFDPGVAMYDWSANFDPTSAPADQRAALPLDVLELPPITTSTASSGFCLSADAQPADGLPWDAPFLEQRNIVAWRNDASAETARLFMDVAANPRLCMVLAPNDTTPNPPNVCALVPGSWTAGSLHTVTGCISAAGAMRLYGDGAQLGATEQLPSGTSVPNLAGGVVRVGNSGSRPWHGYVRKALACIDDVVNCH